jgi:flagellar protein FliJ
MTRSERLKPIQRLNESRENDAARALGHSVQTLQQQTQRLSELQQYRDEYDRKIQELGQNGVIASRLQQMQSFLNNLNLAIAQQQAVVEQAQRQQEQQRHSWQRAHNKSQVMDNVAERYRRDEQYQANKRDQKENDEHALNGTLHKKG